MDRFAPLDRKFHKGQRVRYIKPGSFWEGLEGTVDHSTGPTRFRVFLDAPERTFGITTDQANLEAI